MGADPEKLRNFNGIYISPEANLKRPVAKKKPTGGNQVDLRFKMKDLEYASNMNSDDFFMSDPVTAPNRTNGFKSNQKKPLQQEEPVEDNITQREVDSAVPI